MCAVGRDGAPCMRVCARACVEGMSLGHRCHGAWVTLSSEPPRGPQPHTWLKSSTDTAAGPVCSAVLGVALLSSLSCVQISPCVYQAPKAIFRALYCPGRQRSERFPLLIRGQQGALGSGQEASWLSLFSSMAGRAFLPACAAPVCIPMLALVQSSFEGSWMMGAKPNSYP